VVAVLLLHGVRQSGIRPRPSSSHQALPAGSPQGCRYLRRRPGAGPRNSWSMPGSPGVTTTRSRRWRRSPTTAGASSTPRTRCGSMRCASTRSA
jgi:hypothetical protein